MKSLFVFLVASLMPAVVMAQPAFPGAQGAGQNATGGRGGIVYHVTNLNDSGGGSLRYGLSSVSGPRTIVFDVGGNIHLQSRLTVGSNVTIAGQTAPGDGITLCDHFVSVSGQNIIVRYIRCRMGDTVCPEMPDCLWVNNSSHVIIDHVSASWSIDEVLSVTHGSNYVTVQWCMITEALHWSCMIKDGQLVSHGYGSLISGGDITYHHNLYAHNRSRNPRPGDGTPGTRLDWVNNIIYNAGDQFGYGDGIETNPLIANFVGNYGISGPNTTRTWMYTCDPVKGYFNHFYQSGNKMDTNKNGILDGTLRGWETFSGPENQYAVRFDLPPVTTHSADEAYERVLDQAGASLVRDAVDHRIIQTVINQNGQHLDSQSQVGGWPLLNSAAALPDTDQDGMPNAWEISRGLNASNTLDRNDDADGDGYTNLEEYLNWLCSEQARADISNDFLVDYEDFALLSSAWQAAPGDAAWNVACDLTIPKDDYVDESDLWVFIDHWLGLSN